MVYNVEALCEGGIFETINPHFITSVDWFFIVEILQFTPAFTKRLLAVVVCGFMYFHLHHCLSYVLLYNFYK
jgi:hypothetical protein